jgi:hypothetical protein
MKNVFTLTFLVMLSVTLFAQSITNNHQLHKATKTPTVKPLYDSIDEWPDPSHTPIMAVYKNTDYSYDANGNMLSNVFQQDSSSVYLNLSKVLNTYLPGDLLSTSTSQSWGYSSGWINGDQTIYTYNANNNHDSTIGKYWKNKAWTDTTLVFYQYNSTGLDTFETHQLFKTSNWMNSSRYLYFYNANGFDTCTIQQTWNGSNWTNASKNVSYYNSKNTDTLDVSLIWIDTASYWGNNEKNSHNPNVSGLDSIDIITLGSLHYWGSPYEEINYTYDANNNLIFYSAGSYPGSSGVLYENVAYAYDVNNILISSMTTSAPFHQDSIHYYFHQVVGINKITQKPFIPIYPNPTKGMFTIDNMGKSYTNCMLDVYNITGQIVYHKALHSFNSPTRITVDVPSGIYFIRLNSDQGTVNTKLEITK